MRRDKSLSSPQTNAYIAAEFAQLKIDRDLEIRSASSSIMTDSFLSSTEYFNRKQKLQLLKPEQLEQVMTRGFIGDMDANIFQGPMTTKYSPTGAGTINPLAVPEPLHRPSLNTLLAPRGGLTLTAPNADFDGGLWADLTDNPDGSNDNRRPVDVIPGFPIDELVNLPRFIMNDPAPFAFVNEPQYKPTNLRLPYPKILFELGPEEARHLVVVTQSGEGGFDFRTEYLHTDKETPFEIGAMSHVDLGYNGSDILGVNQMVYQTDPAVAMWTLMAIVGFITEFSVGNTIIGTQARDLNRVIPAPGTTRKYRIVRLVMGVTKVCKPWQGGTHASPREHERMGHWRRVKGEPRWFPAVTVNKGVIGRVMKEYHVRKKTSSPAIQGPET